MEIKTLEIKRSTLPVIEANFEDVKQALQLNLKQYEIEVTASNISESKAKATEINKIKKDIDELRKDAKRMHEAPIKAFEDKAKELMQLCEDARQSILSQTVKYEDARRLEARGKILAYLDSACTLKEVREEYKDHIDISKAVTLTALTSKGELNSKTKDILDLLIGEAKQKQMEYDLKSAEEEKIKSEQEAKRKLELQEAEARGREEVLKSTLEIPNYTENVRTNAETIKEQPIKTDDGKSVYTLKIEYQIMAKSGTNASVIMEKVFPLIMNGTLDYLDFEVIEHESK